MLSNDELLESWLPSVRKAVTSTFLRFKEDPKKILTESDIKCNLYMDLVNHIPNLKYAVHTEVTHYTGGSKKNGKRKYKFRDMSLLCPWEVEENEVLFLKKQELLSKGFKHRGPAFHFEIKIKRQGIVENENSKISAADIRNLNSLQIRKGKEKRFVIVWLSKAKKYDLSYMEHDALTALEKLRPGKNHLIEIYLLDNIKGKVLTFYNSKWVYEELNLD